MSLRQGVVKGHNGIKRAFGQPPVDILCSSRYFQCNSNSKGFRGYLRAGAGAGDPWCPLREATFIKIWFILSKWLHVTLHLLYVLSWQSQATNQLCAKGTQMVHKIFIYISMMGFLLRMKNDQVQRNALWVNRRDNGFVYVLGHQVLNGVAVHASVPSHLPFPLAVDKYPYL